MSAGPRSRVQRRRDTEQRLTRDVDVWVASASADGVPYLVPLSFDWDGEALLVATPADSPTGRNLAATRTVRLGLGLTRDVSMIDLPATHPGLARGGRAARPRADARRPLAGLTPPAGPADQVEPIR